MVLTLLVGGLFGLIFLKLKVPGGAMIGAVCGALLLSLTLHRAYMPYPAKLIAQVVAGCYISCSVQKQDLLQLRHMYRIVLMVIGSFLALNLISGTLLYLFGPLELLTALLCTVPGGMSDVPLIAADMGAEVSSVVILQFIRLCAGIGLFPTWITWVARRRGRECGQSASEEGTSLQGGGGEIGRTPIHILAGTLLIALFSGILGHILGVPAGPLIFSIIATLIVKLFLFPVCLPRNIKRCAQVLSGTYIGCSISYESLLGIHRLILPALFVVAMYMLNARLTGALLHKKFQIPIKEAMLMVTPAGASDMALIAADIGVHSPTLVVTQILRMLAAAAVFPMICYGYAAFFR